MVRAKLIRFNEKRGEGWSETEYVALEFETVGQKRILADLSHGLRALPKKDESEYRYTAESLDIEIPSVLYRAATEAYIADQELQRMTDVFNSTIGRIK